MCSAKYHARLFPAINKPAEFTQPRAHDFALKSLSVDGKSCPVYSRKVEVRLRFLSLLLLLPAVFPRLGGRPIGRTPDSGSGYRGSSPRLPAILLVSMAGAPSKRDPITVIFQKSKSAENRYNIRFFQYCREKSCEHRGTPGIATKPS